MSTKQQRRDEAREELRNPPPEHDEFWYCKSENISTLIRWLYDRDELSLDIDSLCYLLDKPWKWDADYRAMRKELDR